MIMANVNETTNHHHPHRGYLGHGLLSLTNGRKQLARESESGTLEAIVSIEEGRENASSHTFEGHHFRLNRLISGCTLINPPST